MFGKARILVDYGGTIVRDAELFEKICKESQNLKKQNFTPDSWDNISTVGNKNYLDEIKNKFISMGEFYPKVKETISDLCGNGGSSDSEIFVIYDNKPCLNIEPHIIVKHLAFKFKEVDVNGFYFDTDKISFAKRSGMNIVVEDDPRIAISLALSGIKTVLILRKWNIGLSFENFNITMKKDKVEKIKKNIIIAEDWVDVGNKIREIISGE